MNIHQITIDTLQTVVRTADEMAGSVPREWGAPANEVGRFMEAALNNVFEGMPFPTSIVRAVGEHGQDCLAGTDYASWRNDQCLDVWTKIVGQHEDTLRRGCEMMLPATAGEWTKLIRDTHRALFGPFEQSAGKYRAQPVYARRADGTTHMFPKHETIDETLVKGWEVLRNANTEWAQGCGAEYLTVSVHPFPDGNGRTSRVVGNGLSLPWGRRIIKPMNKERYVDGIMAIRQGDDGWDWLELLRDETEDATRLRDVDSPMAAIKDWAQRGWTPDDTPAMDGRIPGEPPGLRTRLHRNWETGAIIATVEASH